MKKKVLVVDRQLDPAKQTPENIEDRRGFVLGMVRQTFRAGHEVQLAPSLQHLKELHGTTLEDYNVVVVHPYVEEFKQIGAYANEDTSRLVVAYGGDDGNASRKDTQAKKRHGKNMFHLNSPVCPDELLELIESH